MTRVVLTPRGATLVAAGLLVLVLAFYTLALVLFLFATFVLAFVTAEILLFGWATRGFGPEAFATERVECSSFVAVQGVGMVAVRLRPRTTAGFYAEVFDAHPDRLEVVGGSPRLVTWWERGDEQTLAYLVRASSRGRFEVGPTRVVAHDTFGFAFRETALPTPWTLEAIPHYPSVRLRRSARFPTPTFGASPNPARGSGMEFHSLREYVSTDDPRRIAWSRSTKGPMYVREFQRESQEEVVVLLDLGRAMSAGPGTSEALEAAVEAAGFAAQYAVDEEIRFGLLLFSDHIVRHLRPERGAEHEFEIARALAGAEVEPCTSSLASVLDYLGPRLAFPAHLLAFTALDDPPAELARAWGGLARAGHQLHVFVPDLERLYPPIPDPVGQRAFEILRAPEVRRVEAHVEGVRSLGLPVARFGRRDATEGVTLVFAQVRGRRVAA